MSDMGFEELQQIVSICLDEIVALKEEVGALKSENVQLKERINNTVVQLKNVLVSSKTIADNNEAHFERLECAIDNLKYELNDPGLDKSLCYYPEFYSIEETIRDIVDNGKSMARFGDGEFAIMSNVERHHFQHIDKGLAARLQEVIATNEEGFLVAIADNYGSLEKYNEGGKAGIRYYMTAETRAQHVNWIDVNRKYYNAYISRPYALFADNGTDAPKRRFEALKEIWNGRKVIFVEGSLTRLGVGNTLFDNASGIHRIVCPPLNAYDKYTEILQAALKYAQKDTLFLIALGPAAGVLAYDLYQAGYQAIDVGHVDLEYEWYLAGNGKRCEVKHKYNNEYPGGDRVEDIQDENYLKQILCVVQ